MPLVLSVYMSKTGVLDIYLNWDRNPNLNKCLRTPAFYGTVVFVRGVDVFCSGSGTLFCGSSVAQIVGFLVVIVLKACAQCGRRKLFISETTACAFGNNLGLSTVMYMVA